MRIRLTTLDGCRLEEARRRCMGACRARLCNDGRMRRLAIDTALGFIVTLEFERCPDVTPFCALERCR